jgi:hypothetical protein
MNKVLKWVLIVLGGLVGLVIVFGIVFAIFGGGHGYYMMRPGFRMMEPYGYRHSFVSPMGGIFGGLLGLGLLVLIIVGIVALVNAIIRGNRPAQVTQSVQATPAEPTPAPMPASTRTCSNCGKPAQDDWQTCPYCGSPLT